MESITSKLRSLMHTVSVHSRPGARGGDTGAGAANHRNSPKMRPRVGQPYRTSSVESQNSQHCQDYQIDGLNNSSISANKLVDKLLDYLRENYVQPIDPYVLDTSYDFSPRKYVKFVITSGNIHGLTNFERIGDSFIVRSPESDLRFRLCSYVLVTDIVLDLKFTANFTPIRVKRKTLKIFCEKCVLYTELTLDLRPKNQTQVTKLKLISIADIECKTGGVMFPLNRSFDSLFTKVLHNLCKNFDQHSPKLMKLINQFCQQYLDNVFKLSNFTELFM